MNSFVKRNFIRALLAALLLLTVCTGINFYIYLYSYKFIQSDTVPTRSTCIVPGARVYSDGVLSDIYKDRLLTAEDIFRNRKVSNILISADDRQSHNNQTSAGSLFLTKREISIKNIFSDTSGHTTYDTMTHAKKIFGVNDAVIVTQQYHLYRSLFIARKIGIDAIGVSSDRQSYRNIRYFKFREFFANVKAFIEVICNTGL